MTPPVLATMSLNRGWPWVTFPSLTCDGVEQQKLWRAEQRTVSPPFWWQFHCRACFLQKGTLCRSSSVSKAAIDKSWEESWNISVGSAPITISLIHKKHYMRGFYELLWLFGFASCGGGQPVMEGTLKKLAPLLRDQKAQRGRCWHESAFFFDSVWAYRTAPLTHKGLLPFINLHWKKSLQIDSKLNPIPALDIP